MDLAFTVVDPLIEYFLRYGSGRCAVALFCGIRACDDKPVAGGECKGGTVVNSRAVRLISVNGRVGGKGTVRIGGVEVYAFRRLYEPNVSDRCRTGAERAVIGNVNAVILDDLNSRHRRRAAGAARTVIELVHALIENYAQRLHFPAAVVVQNLNFFYACAFFDNDFLVGADRNISVPTAETDLADLRSGCADHERALMGNGSSTGNVDIKLIAVAEIQRAVCFARRGVRSIADGRADVLHVIQCKRITEGNELFAVCPAFDERKVLEYRRTAKLHMVFAEADYAVGIKTFVGDGSRMLRDGGSSGIGQNILNRSSVRNIVGTVGSRPRIVAGIYRIFGIAVGILAVENLDRTVVVETDRGNGGGKRLERRLGGKTVVIVRAVLVGNVYDIGS